MRILVIDTDKQFCSKLEGRFKPAGVDCRIFAQGEAAIAELLKDPDAIDIVLISRELDANDERGLAFAVEIRKSAKTSDVPYIVMSKSWTKADFAKHQKSEFGANAYFNKQNSLSELAANIEAVTGVKVPAGKIEATKTHSATFSSSQVQLHEATQVVNINEHVPDGIALEVPINLFEALGPAAAEPTPERSASSTQSDVKFIEPVIQPPQVTASVSEPAVAPSQSPAISSASANSAQADPVIVLDGMIEATEGQTKEVAIETPAAPPAPVGEELQLAASSQQPAIEQPAALSTTHGASEPADGVVLSESVIVPEEPVVDLSKLMNVIQAMPSIPVEAAPAQASIELPVQSVVENLGLREAAATAKAEEAIAEISTDATEDAANDLPYLFGSEQASKLKAPSESGRHLGTTAFQMSPTNAEADPESADAVKRYLSMREQDIAVLTAQLTYAKEELSKSEDSIKRLMQQNEDLLHSMNDLKARFDQQNQELQYAGRSKEGELDQLRFEVKAKIERIRFLEEKLGDSAHQYEKLKERVRLDIRKIRVREKELESKLEILKKDSETLIASRENKILELKRKIDLLEFNYDTLQDKNEAEKQKVAQFKEKIERLLKVLKLAQGIIDADEDTMPERGTSSDAA